MTSRRVPRSGRRRPFAIVSLAILAAILTGSCSKDPTSPGARYTLSGRVRLVGFKVDPDGRFAGTQTVDDADGVPVELRYGASVIASTVTVDGVYRFPGLVPGAYRVRSSVVPSVADETANLTISYGDIFSLDTIELRSAGDLVPTPNPFSSFVRILFEIPDSQFVEVRIRDLRGNTKIQLFGQGLPAGLYETAWTVPPSDTEPYSWVTFESHIYGRTESRAHLLMR
jgi:hypothetical protein